MKRTLALIVALLCLAAPVAADNPRGHLLSGVQTGRVVEVSATVGMLDNSRAWTGQAAQDAVARAQAVEVEFRSNDRIQPWTWDWTTNTPRTDVTPLVFSLAVKEAWSVEGAAVEYNRYNVLACYDVGLIELYHCRQYQGSSGDEYLSSHINSIALWRDDGDSLVDALFQEDEGMEDIKDFVLKPEVVAFLVFVAGIAISQLIALFRSKSRAEWVAFVQSQTPDQLDAVAGKLAERAYDAVEKLAAAYGDMTSEQKQAKAVELLQFLFKLLYNVKPSKGASVALIESYAFRREQVDKEVSGRGLAA